jgi:hypothetical protein
LTLLLGLGKFHDRKPEVPQRLHDGLEALEGERFYDIAIRAQIVALGYIFFRSR